MKQLRQGGFLISKIHQLSGRIFSKKLKDYDVDLNPAQGRILFVLWQKDAISINELAQKTALSKSTLTSMLDRLESVGYLKRVPSPEDRRQILIKLTPKNETVQAIHHKVSEEMTELFYRGFGPEEIDRFESYLTRIYQNLETVESNKINPEDSDEPESI
ncbi:MAG: MarR family winged helix-turn-helix transcriptional regulator [Bacteroidota bacterium]